MAQPEEVAVKVLEIAVVPLVLGLFGWLGGRRQGITAERAAREQREQAGEEIQDRRETREIELALEQINEVRTWWTAELAKARTERDEERVRYSILWRWAVNMVARWNARHPEDPCDLPNGKVVEAR